ncbi:DoxX family protein [Rhizobium johnstonii]|uniref:DoxX family protein n=2 Tax=Rhizobium/Agrobacterium group TaxID=227290 RepID=UPI00140FAF53|nr:hypothetical protein [Rhizobium leguminosarum]QIO64055.1 hypothetical protein HA462_02880 [Rhizobium leguminosarum bv. trifolii]
MRQMLSLSLGNLSSAGRALLRLALALSALLHQPEDGFGCCLAYIPAANYLALCFSVSLTVGLATRISAVALGALFIWEEMEWTPGDECRLYLSAISFALAMLGPGRFSLDALLFGRQRVRIPD